MAVSGGICPQDRFLPLPKEGTINVKDLSKYGLFQMDQMFDSCCQCPCPAGDFWDLFGCNE